MCRFSIPFVVSHASHLFWIWNKQIQHCPWLQQCMCASTSVCVCGMQTILLVFQFICWARRVFSSMCGEILFCMCAICVIQRYARIWRLSTCSTHSIALLSILLSIHSVRKTIHNRYQNPQTNVRCAFTLIACVCVSLSLCVSVYVRLRHERKREGHSMQTVCAIRPHRHS